MLGGNGVESPSGRLIDRLSDGGEGVRKGPPEHDEPEQRERAGQRGHESVLHEALPRARIVDAAHRVHSSGGVSTAGMSATSRNSLPSSSSSAVTPIDDARPWISRHFTA